MFVLKQIFDLYIKSSLHVAFAIFSFVKVVELSLNISSNVFLEVAIFSGTVLGYSVLKYYEFWKSTNFSVHKNKSVLGITTVAFLTFVFCFFQLKFSFQIAFFQIFFLVLLYPFLRKYWFLKIAVVSFCVTYVVSYIPTLETKTVFFYDTILQVKLFFLICALLIPFEIYDSQHDAITLQTIPQKFGIKKTKYLGYFFLICFCILSLIFRFERFDVVIAIIIGLFIRFSSTKNTKYYTSFWVESIPILWWLILVLF
jgi:4-hydroxybenzoate polyprenyltransferase